MQVRTMVPETGYGQNYPFPGEKLSAGASRISRQGFADAKRIVRDFSNIMGGGWGQGHSCGIHTKNAEHARELARTRCRACAGHQAHPRPRRGFNNGLAFTLSIGVAAHVAGQRHLRASRRCSSTSPTCHTIGEDKPSEAELFRWAIVKVR